MFPVKDNIPKRRFPLVTIVLLASTVATYLLTHDGGLLALLLDVLCLALLGPSVESTLGHARFCALCLFGGLLALSVGALVGASATTLLLLCVVGPIAAVLCGYLPLHPRGRVLTLVVLPFFVTIVEIPAAFLLALWFAAQIYFGTLGAL